METQLNKVMLRGTVGNIRVSQVGETKMARLSLATNIVYKNREGTVTIESTWHTVVIWQKPEFPALETIQKGDKLYIEGRIKCGRYVNQDGTENNVYEILASKVEKIEDNISLEEVV